MLGRILRCQQAGVPITNYGLTIAYSLGIFARALEPFPAALMAWRRAALVPEHATPLRTLATRQVSQPRQQAKALQA
jgi:hypothetical protein